MRREMDVKGWLAVIVVVILALAATGCGGRLPGMDADNKVTTTTTHPDGRVEIKVEEKSDATTFVDGQVRGIKEQKATVDIEAQPGQTIELKGVKRFAVYANNNQVVKQHQPAWERVLINGLPLAAMVAQGYISADMANKLVASVGAAVGSRIYNITTKDGSPVQISGGNIANGTITVSEPATTTTTTTTEQAK